MSPNRNKTPVYGSSIIPTNLYNITYCVKHVKGTIVYKLKNCNYKLAAHSKHLMFPITVGVRHTESAFGCRSDPASILNQSI